MYKCLWLYFDCSRVVIYRELKALLTRKQTFIQILRLIPYASAPRKGASARWGYRVAGITMRTVLGRLENPQKGVVVRYLNLRQAVAELGHLDRPQT